MDREEVLKLSLRVYPKQPFNGQTKLATRVQAIMELRSNFSESSTRMSLASILRRSVGLSIMLISNNFCSSLF